MKHAKHPLSCGLAAAILIFGFTSCVKHREAKVQMRRDHIIVDRLERAESYYHMHPAFEKAFTFLRQDALAELPIMTSCWPTIPFPSCTRISWSQKR